MRILRSTAAVALAAGLVQVDVAGDRWSARADVDGVGMVDAIERTIVAVVASGGAIAGYRRAWTGHVIHFAGVNLVAGFQAGCISASIVVRERPDAWHAVLRLSPAEAQVALQERLDLADVSCRSIPLEDMFVELAGSRS